MPFEHITRSILVLRGQRVILDRELAAIYGVETRALNQAVRHNAERFPKDFMFRLTAAEPAASRSQSVILKPTRGQNIKLAAVRLPPSAVIMGDCHKQLISKANLSTCGE